MNRRQRRKKEREARKQNKVKRQLSAVIERETTRIIDAAAGGRPVGKVTATKGKPIEVRVETEATGSVGVTRGLRSTASASTRASAELEAKASKPLVEPSEDMGEGAILPRLGLLVLAALIAALIVLVITGVVGCATAQEVPEIRSPETHTAYQGDRPAGGYMPFTEKPTTERPIETSAGASTWWGGRLTTDTRRRTR